MNQVQETLRLHGRVEDAMARLGGLFGVMAQQPGFLDANVGRGIDDPGLLLVLHAWQRLEDWQAFQRSPWKLAFSAERPSGLYEFVPSPMNWAPLGAGVGVVREFAYVRRSSLPGALVPPDYADLYRYVDNDPAFTATPMRLEYSMTLPAPGAASDDAPASDRFVLLHRHVATPGAVVAASAS